MRELIERRLEGSELFLVEINATPYNEIEVLIDSDASVGIDACVELSKAIEAEFDREAEDYELMVASAGIGQPLKVLRQYRKLIGKNVELVLKNGLKLVAVLKDADEDKLVVSYMEKIAVEGKKRKQEVETVKEFALSDIKSTSEHLDYK